MSFVLNRNVKEAKVIKYSGGEYIVSVENNNKLKFINLKPISKSNLIEKNNLKKLYLINIGEKKNSNGQKIFLVGTTKKFNETVVMNVVEEEDDEEEEKKENQTMSNIYGNPNNNNTRMNYENSPMRSRSEEEEIETINKYYVNPNNNQITYTNNPLYKKKNLPKSMNVIVEKKPINKFNIGNRVIYTSKGIKGIKEIEESGSISGRIVTPSGRILYNFTNNKGISKPGISINHLRKEKNNK